MHPEYQQRVFDEMKSIFPDQKSDVTSGDLVNLKYTDCFIKEVFRLCPTVPMISRRATTPTKISSWWRMAIDIFQKCILIKSNLGTTEIPAGTELVISIFQLHRNKDVWGPDADIFNPDNFLPENIRKIHKYAFIPFSSGPRNCIGNENCFFLINWKINEIIILNFIIGMKYGNQSIRIFTCWLVRNYRFETDLTMDQLKFRINVTLKLENKHMIRMYKRTNYTW